MIPGSTSLESKENREDTWDSQKWLQKYGLKAQKLTFYDVIADCSFRHADGVVDIKGKPEDESVQTSAVGESCQGCGSSLGAWGQGVCEAFLGSDAKGKTTLKGGRGGSCLGFP